MHASSSDARLAWTGMEVQCLQPEGTRAVCKRSFPPLGGRSGAMLTCSAQSTIRLEAVAAPLGGLSLDLVSSDVGDVNQGAIIATESVARMRGVCILSAAVVF